MSTEVYSDYGSGSSINSTKSCVSQDNEDWSKQYKQPVGQPPIQKTTSFLDLVLGRCSLEDAMREFRLNGSDSPYNPDEEFSFKRASAPAVPSYRRQTSWPAPELTPLQPLPQPPAQLATTLMQPGVQPATTLQSPPVQPATTLQSPPVQPAITLLQLAAQTAPMLQPTTTLPSAGLPSNVLSANLLTRNECNMLPETYLPASKGNGNVWTDAVGYEETFQINEPAPTFSTSTPIHVEELTAEQRRVLSSLSDEALHCLLRDMEAARGAHLMDKSKKRNNTECRFCKNNGERESYYRSHSLKDAQGRVCCPVLRRYRCSRCLATGDHAHTAKYCPLTTADERMKSCAMMRSVRVSSGRHRRGARYVLFGETPCHVITDTASAAYLHPHWALLEQKLMM